MDHPRSGPVALVFAAALCACSPSQAPIELHTTQSLAGAIQAFAAELPWDPVRVQIDADPAASVGGDGDGLRVAVVADLAGCAECFSVTAQGAGFVVHGDGPLGAQYGLATLLEAAGFRFHSPLHPAAPAKLLTPAADGQRHAAEKRLRGLHLHTLHPIEGYFSHWADGPDGQIDDARRIHAWLVQNRANYVEWVALADIVTDADRAQAWRARTRQIVDDAHARGLRAGIGVELFKASDLQLGFDLIDADPAMAGDPTAAIDQRLGLLAGLGFDVVNVSFGEFSAFDPAIFINALNVAAREIRARLGAQVAATVHVGGRPSQQVNYMGQMLPYYFLVKFADPIIDPWIHTVMYYDLFEDAGGAYDMDSFAAHRQYVLDRLGAGQPVAYYPETAYWITFDDSVPLYLPLYARSRFHDMSQLRAAAAAGGFGDLAEHVQFSSGFEWGYWQQDRLTLRMSYELPARYEDAFADLFPPELAADVVALADAQHDALIGQRLAPYLAGRDAYLDAGDQIGIHSEPPRPSFAAPVATVLGPLGDLADRMKSIAAAAARHADPSDPDQAEVADGAAIDAARARFIHDLYAVAVAKGAGGDTAAPLSDASAALSEAQAIVARRHAGIPMMYRESGASNATIYAYGYLAQAETLCYWQREMAQIANLLSGKNDTVTGCIF